MAGATDQTRSSGGERPAGRRRRSRSRSDQARLALAAALGGLTVAFAALNLDKVEVDWIIDTFSTPLIVVIVVSLVVGGVLGFATGRRRRGGKPASSRTSRGD